MTVTEMIAALLRNLQRVLGSLADGLDSPAGPCRRCRQEMARKRSEPRGSSPRSEREAELGGLVRALNHRKAVVRAGAADQLGTHGFSEAAEALVRATRDRRREVRRAALGALLRVAPGRFVDATMHLANVHAPSEVLVDLDAMVEWATDVTGRTTADVGE